MQGTLRQNLDPAGVHTAAELDELLQWTGLSRPASAAAATGLLSRVRKLGSER